MIIATIDSLLSDNGFPAAKDVRGLSSIHRLFKGRKRLSGIYVLHFEDGEYYVGKSVNVVSRFAQHYQTYDDIVRLSFKVAAKAKHDEEERRMVHVLENAGYALRNKTLVFHSASETDFDHVMPLETQERWLNDLDYVDADGERLVDANLRKKYTSDCHKWMQRPHAEAMLPVLRRYVQQTIPAYIRGESAFWSLSVKDEKTEPHLYLRVNVGVQMTLSVNGDHRGAFFWFLMLREQARKITSLPFLTGWMPMYRFRLSTGAFLPVHVVNSRMSAAGSPQVALVVNSEKALRLLDDPIALTMMRQFNLESARKAPCRWGRYHCLDLADLLVT